MVKPDAQALFYPESTPEFEPILGMLNPTSAKNRVAPSPLAKSAEEELNDLLDDEIFGGARSSFASRLFEQPQLGLFSSGTSLGVFTSILFAH